MKHWKPEKTDTYCRWVLPASAWTKAQPFDDGRLKIIFDFDGEWLGAADVSDGDGSRFLGPEEIASIRAEFGLDCCCLELMPPRKFSEQPAIGLGSSGYFCADYSI